MSDIPTTSSEHNVVVSTETSSDLDEPQKKRMKISGTATNSNNGNNTIGSDSDKLENRLGGILCCTVCLDLPKSAVYQCTNGHLMCAGCFTHILADARIRDESATCPNCRTEINKTIATRNLAVEKAISELPSECQYCGREFSRNTLAHHEETNCEERKTGCKFSRIGCPWIGPEHEKLEHESQCVHPKKTGDEIMDALKIIDAKIEEERRFFNTVFDLLSYEKLTFIDLQLKPYRTEEFIHRLFYETSRFSAFNNQWVVKARINNNQRDPSQCSERDISYQLSLKTKSGLPFTLHFLILPGPFADMKLSSKVHKHEFTDQSNESVYLPLPLTGSDECNRLLSLKIINFRILMFMSSK